MKSIEEREHHRVLANLCAEHAANWHYVMEHERDREFGCLPSVVAQMASRAESWAKQAMSHRLELLS